METDIAMPLRILMRSLWLHWAKIAIRQERRTWAARDSGQSHLTLEIEESIQTVAAARHCIHNLYRVWKDGLGLSSEADVRLTTFTTGAPADQDRWSQRVLGLIGDRNDAVHYDEETAPAQPHPLYDTNVSGVAALFTAERATKAVDVMLEDVLRLAFDSPSDALDEWAKAHGHVLALLDRQRTTGEDVW